MILFTVNPASGYTGMLSIPRDLLVKLRVGLKPDNTAHVYGEINQPAAVPPPPWRRSARIFGVGRARYVRLDLAGFVQIVDAIGGMI